MDDFDVMIQVEEIYAEVYEGIDEPSPITDAELDEMSKGYALAPNCDMELPF